MRRLAIVAVAIATAFALTLPADTASAARPIGAANAKALAALQNAKPVLEGVTTLADFTGLKGRFLTHAGPPIDYAHMSGAQQGAMWAAILFEGWAPDLESAKRLAPRIRLRTNHELDGVGGMAGVVSPSMLVYVVRDATSGKRAYSVHEYESFFGLFDEATVNQIRFWNTTVMPTIGRAVRSLGEVELNPIMADALLRGDEMHCLTTSATNALLGMLAPAIVETSNDADAAATLKELAAFPHLAMLGIGMGASKAASMAAEGVKGSSLITVMARNGTTEGIQISAFPGRWFVVPAAEIQLVPFPGNEGIKPGRDLGDSAVQEVWGFGAGSAAAAAYSGLAAEVGLTPAQMIATSRRQARISLGTKTGFPILQLGGPPGLGLDARLVVAKKLPPRILTAAAAAEPGHPILGLGVSEMPVAASKKAVDALNR
jgi:Protein of unknown function (DUF1116)